ncbi:MAG: hypothetical protein WCH46_00465 [bacterium]
MQGNTQNITLRVDASAALAYQSASKEEKMKLGTFFSILMKERSREKDTPSLLEVMDRMSDYAEKQGLTDEILKEILAEDA